jgi:hypothetical protein
MKTASGRADVSPSAEGTTRTEKTAPAKLTRRRCRRDRIDITVKEEEHALGVRREASGHQLGNGGRYVDADELQIRWPAEREGFAVVSELVEGQEAVENGKAPIFQGDLWCSSTSN